MLRDQQQCKATQNSTLISIILDFMIVIVDEADELNFGDGELCNFPHSTVQ